MSDGANVDAAAIAVAAHDIRLLVRWTPERLLWAPGRPIWGIALVRESSRAIIAIDGCLTVAMTIWPGHYIPNGAYPLDAIVRLLASSMGIKRLDGSAMFTCHLPQAVSGSCCVIVTQNELPWLSPDLALLPLTEQPVWTAPQDPPSTAHLLPIHPWHTLAGLRPACGRAAELFATIGEPPELQILPDGQRRDRLISYWRMHAMHERERLRLAEHQVPGWLTDEADLLRLVEAWILGWRGPGEPNVRALQSARERQQPPATPLPAAAPQVAHPPTPTTIGSLSDANPLGDDANPLASDDPTAQGDAWTSPI